ncbi:MAG: fibronectin type III domain-containing protein [Anaerolineaceae bacterium]|nr:fibronectin type III domain-containing protein [Anaerolineaceae bacterium]
MEQKITRSPRWGKYGVALVIATVLLAGMGVILVFAAGPGIFLPVVVQNYKVCTAGLQLSWPAEGARLDGLVPEFSGDSGQESSTRYILIQVATDPGFASIVHTVTANTARGAFSSHPMGNLAPAATYYWRAQRVCGAISGPFTPARSFSTAESPSLPEAPRLSTPEAHAIAERPVMLSWEAVSGAREYLLYYRADAAHGWYIISTDQVTLTRKLAANATYEWYVIARSSSGYSPESVHQTFTTGS